MWLAQLAAGAASDAVPLSTIVMGLIAVLGAIVTAYASLRGTWRTTEVQREANINKRVDDKLEKAEQRNELLEAKANRYQELYFELRFACIRKGYDPDELLGEVTPDGPS